MDEELRFHLEQQVAANLAAGMSPGEAQRAAAIEFGGLEQVKEQCRDVRKSTLWSQWVQDLRYALRQLRKAPGFATTAILTVAIGIGACTAMFSIVNGVVLRPLPFPHPDQIVVLSETRENNEMPVAPATYLDWAKKTSVFENLAAMTQRSYNSTSSGRASSIGADLVTANYFSVIGIQPMLGRAFLPEEEIAGRDHVAILSYRIWQNRFGGRANVVNQTIKLDDQPYTIVGVMPNRRVVQNRAVFIPLTFSPADRGDYGSHNFTVLGRLQDGVSLRQAQADLDVVCEQIAQAHPASNRGNGARVIRLLSSMIGDARLQLLVLLGAVGFLLLIAGVNVASLLLARAGARSRELAVRAALGASRGRLIRQFLCESLVITMAGGLLGTMIAYVSLGMLVRFTSAYVPRTDQVALDGSVLTWSLGLMLLTGIAVGLIPALQSTSGDMIEALKGSGRGPGGGPKRQRARVVLVVTEIALALMLLTGTGLLARSLLALQSADQGFKTDDVQVGWLALAGNAYNSPEKAGAFVSAALGRLSALPDVRAATFSTGLPMVANRGLLFALPGQTDLPPTALHAANTNSVTPDYFKALSIPILRGRGLTAGDRATAPKVAVINEELADKYFAGVNPIGQRINIYTMSDHPDAWWEVVGIAGNVRQDGPQSDLVAQVYLPLPQQPVGNATGSLFAIVRANGPARALPGAVRDVMRSLDPNLAFDRPQSYSEGMESAWSRQKFSVILFALFSGIALLLAAIGIYGVMAYAVSQRTREIGIRMALGAKGSDVVRLVLGNGGRIVLGGLLVGAAGSLAFGRLLSALLFDTSPADPATLGAVAALLALIALIACWIPARRATQVDPVVALRAD